MHPVATSARQTLFGLAPAILLAACGGTPPAAPPLPISGPTISLQQDWRARVLVERDDSIVLTLPSGDHQLQQFHRSAVFTLDLARNGAVALRLDSLTVRPTRDDAAHGTPLLAAWTGRADDPRITAFRVSAGGDLADELTSMVGHLLPRFPAGGASQTTWSDSADGTVRVDIFTANERRAATWIVGPASHDSAGTSLSVRVRESFEQLGTSSHGGQKITMTSQGSRSGVYYSTRGGRLTSAQLVDSTSMLISLPETRQVVPTQRIGRAAVRFISIPRDSSEE